MAIDNPLEEYLPYIKTRPKYYSAIRTCIEVAAYSWLLFDIILFYLFGLRIFLFLLFPFFLLRRLARRYAIDGKKALLKDKRLPILFLRSFQDDQSYNKGRRDLKTSEELLVSVLWDIGPVIAVGRPSENLPLFGGIRMYFTTNEWQEKVERLMTISQMVVISAGYSAGLLWEISTARRLLNPEKILCSFVALQSKAKKVRQTEYELAKQHTEKAIGFPLPSQLGDRIVLHFDRDWTPEWIALNFWKRILYGGLSAPAIRESLRPLFLQRGHLLKKWKTVAYVLIIILLAILCIPTVIIFLLVLIALCRGLIG